MRRPGLFLVAAVRARALVAAAAGACLPDHDLIYSGADRDAAGEAPPWLAAKARSSGAQLTALRVALETTEVEQDTALVLNPGIVAGRHVERVAGSHVQLAAG